MLKIFNIYTLALILIYSTVSGCQEQKKDDAELRYTYYKGGEVESEAQYVNGIRNGYRKFFDENGKLLSESQYVNGKREGMMKSYYPDGSLLMSANFVNDVMEGEVLYFYPDGKIQSKKIFENGKMISDAHYKPDGKLDFEEKF
jgi:antitoxin component YwqK of YwqJK toxin-antitoxin module